LNRYLRDTGRLTMSRCRVCWSWARVCIA
jgi:hypothetical protein